ncbi:MAG: hypothetical protein RLZ98_3454 [Pseudomonadota bacterium]
MPRGLIVGLSGLELSDGERDYLRHVVPAGIILFGRNCSSPDQVRRLVVEAQDAAGSEMLVGIDQEGGRVQRLRPPHWRALPAAERFVTCCSDLDEAGTEASLIALLAAHELRSVGITMNCAPVLDLRFEGAHDIIGDRAYGRKVEEVVRVGGAAARGYMAGGVVPVAKHIPGHGRALADSHLELPVVDATRRELEEADFEPFRQLAGLPAAMTAHVVYTAIDASRAGSVSAIVTRDVIRSSIGFDGLLMSDDLSMRALSGSIAARAAAVIEAGSDLALHCNGNLDEMVSAAAAVPEICGDSLRRFLRCIEITRRVAEIDVVSAEQCLARLMRV